VVSKIQDEVKLSIKTGAAQLKNLVGFSSTVAGLAHAPKPVLC
jgi:hypothetical protein